jgi:hypothetical protein
MITDKEAELVNADKLIYICRELQEQMSARMDLFTWVNVSLRWAWHFRSWVIEFRAKDRSGLVHNLDRAFALTSHRGSVDHYVQEMVKSVLRSVDRSCRRPAG